MLIIIGLILIGIGCAIGDLSQRSQKRKNYQNLLNKINQIINEPIEKNNEGQ